MENNPVVIALFYQGREIFARLGRDIGKKAQFNWALRGFENGGDGGSGHEEDGKAE